MAAHDWTGELAANGSVVPLVPKAAALKAIPAYARKAFVSHPSNKEFANDEFT